MSTAITRCPKCKTSFKVNSAHLNTARGAVRCGSCLTIFNAKENLVGAPAKPKPTPPKPKTTPPPVTTPVPEQSDAFDDDMLISDDMSDPAEQEESDFDENIFVAGTTAKSDINLFERKQRKNDNDDGNRSDTDESWALNLLEEDEHDARAQQRPEESPSDVSSDDAAPDVDNEPSFRVIDDDFSGEFHALFDEGPAPTESEVAEMEHEERVEDLFEDSESDADNDRDFLHTLEPEPLELHVRHHAPIWQSNVFWLVLSALALFLALFQMAAFNFDSWSRKQSLRPYYAQACGVFGCTLPVLQNLDRIRITNMVVVDHPQLSQTLLVDATLLNQADFEQYFPTLLLTFTNLSNEILSRHEFPPSSYVGGELAGHTLMPARHPIHITLEIPDPGAEAVNYQISVVKP